MSKDTPNVFISVKENGEQVIKEYEIAGKKFKKLDDEVKETLLACTLEFCTLSDYTDDIASEHAKDGASVKYFTNLSKKIIGEEFLDLNWPLYSFNKERDRIMILTVSFYKVE